MRDNYDKFLFRLNKYRVNLNMTQEETSIELGITQSQLSKMELGRIVMPFRIFELLLKMGWDVDYLVTGKRSCTRSSELNTLIRRGEENRKELLRALAWLLELGIEKSSVELNKEIKCEIAILRRRSGQITSESVLHEVRKIAGYSQIPMSEKLGVNIRKYRMLEKEQIRPDVELLIRIYEVTGCKPSFFLDDTENRIIDDLWDRITPAIRRKILALAEQIFWFLKM